MSAPRTIYLVPARNVASRPIAAAPSQRSTVPINRTVTPVIRQRYSTPTPSVKRSCTPLDPIEDLLNEYSGGGPPRKRERLNHLTAEEKLNRRKLKNRVAAQTARDRKKVRSQRLEDVVRQLLDENQRLRDENSRLRDVAEQQRCEKDNGRETAIESAAFISGPLPRVQATSLPQSLLQLLLLCLSTSFPNTSSTGSSKTSRRTLTSISSPASCPAIRKTPQTCRRRRRPLLRRRLWTRVS